MIQELVKRWEDHNLMVKWMWDMFRYIDRFYVTRNNRDNLREVALKRFRELIFNRVNTPLTHNTTQLSTHTYTHTYIHTPTYHYISLSHNAAFIFYLLLN